MRRKTASWILWTAALAAALAGAWALRGSAVYRGYVVGRQTGAVVFSIVQAVGPGGSPEAAGDPCAPARVREHGAGRL